MNKDIRELSTVFNILSNEVRLCILFQILDEEKNVTNLQKCTNVSQSVVSQQLSKLKAMNIIKANKIGNEVYYSIKDKKIKTMLDYFYEISDK